MAELTAKQRAALPSKDFGLPEKARSAAAKKETGNYPMPDRGHAISAKRLSRKNRRDGNLTKDEFEWTNLADDSSLAKVKAELQKALPKTDHENVKAADAAQAETKKERNKRRRAAAAGNN